MDNTFVALTSCSYSTKSTRTCCKRCIDYIRITGKCCNTGQYYILDAEESSHLPSQDPLYSSFSIHSDAQPPPHSLDHNSQPGDPSTDDDESAE